MNRWPGGWWIDPTCFFSFFIWFLFLSSVYANSTITIRNDSGGSLQERLDEIEVLRMSGEEIRITGYCASACTMYLVLPNTCVTKGAKLAFHGPQTQYYGVSLTAIDFEKWSKLIAEQYPPSICEKYLNEWRYTTVGAVQISGTEAIRMGVRECK